MNVRAMTAAARNAASAAEKPAPAHIAARGVAVDFTVEGRRQRVLNDINVAVPKGSFVSLIGPSGCGKSTLLKVMAGLVAPTEGEVTVAGMTPQQAVKARLIGLVFQDATLLPWKNALENAAFLLMTADGTIKRADAFGRAAAMLKLVGLDSFGGRYPHELSGGMKQRVSIARGLVQDPPVLLMDEPFAALDEQTRMTMGHELLRIWDETNKTVVFITHSLTEAVYLADEVLVMSARPGRILDRVAIDLPRPRTYQMMATDKFGQLRERIWQQIRAKE